MKMRARRLAMGVLVIVCGSVIGCGGDDPALEPPPRWALTLADEFDGPEGTPPDPSIWTYDVGGGGFGNNQLEFNTNRVENVALDGRGHLRIVAREEAFFGNAYTSGRIKTQGLFAQRYGRFEARIKLPAGQGLWPAFWMLGADFGTVGWPQSGEIDIMEFRGQEVDVIHGSMHGPGYSGASAMTSRFRLGDGETFVDDFHVFAIDWDPGVIRYSVDGRVYQTISTAAVAARGEWVFDQPFFLLLNLAVGGNFVGPVGRNTEFPAEMLVDYVRVFERAR